MLLPNFKQIQRNLTVHHALFLYQHYAFIAFDLKYQIFRLPTQTPLHCSNLFLELRIFVYLLLQLSSNSLPTSTNVLIPFPHFFRFMRDSRRARLALESGRRFGARVTSYTSM